MIAQQLLDSITSQIEQQGLSEGLMGQLRQTHQNLHFTYCMDDDIHAGHQPIIQRPQFNIYLVDGRNHCLQLTTDLQVATGLVLAEVEAD